MLTHRNLRLSFDIACTQRNGENSPTELTPSAFVAIARHFRNTSYPADPLDTALAADDSPGGPTNSLVKNHMLVTPSSTVRLRLYKKMSIECEGENIDLVRKWCNAFMECLRTILKGVKEFRGADVRFSQPRINNLIANAVLYPCNTFKLYNAIMSEMGLFTLNGRDRPTEESTSICLNHRIKGTSHHPSFTISGTSLRVMGCIDPDYLNSIYNDLYSLSKRVGY